MQLKPVTLDDYDFLYKMLANRSPEENISHKEMPTKEAHQTFWVSNPYKKAYIIWQKGMRTGYCYVTYQNELGVHTVDGGEADVIEKFPECEIHVSPNNKSLQKTLERLGYKIIQLTFTK